MGRFTGGEVVYFHYLDDILLLGRNTTLLRVVTCGLCEFMQAQSLLISTKSQTEPLALVTWIGKTFDLARGTVRNTPGTVRKALAVVVRAAVSSLTPKRVERVTGRLQWLFGPLEGHDSVHVWLVQVEVCRFQVCTQTLTHDDPQHGGASFPRGFAMGQSSQSHGGGN